MKLSLIEFFIQIIYILGKLKLGNFNSSIVSSKLEHTTSLELTHIHTYRLLKRFQSISGELDIGLSTGNSTVMIWFTITIFFLFTVYMYTDTLDYGNFIFIRRIITHEFFCNLLNQLHITV